MIVRKITEYQVEESLRCTNKAQSNLGPNDDRAPPPQKKKKQKKKNKQKKKKKKQKKTGFSVVSGTIKTTCFQLTFNNSYRSITFRNERRACNLLVQCRSAICKCKEGMQFTVYLLLIIIQHLFEASTCKSLTSCIVPFLS